MKSRFIFEVASKCARYCAKLRKGLRLKNYSILRTQYVDLRTIVAAERMKHLRRGAETEIPRCNSWRELEKHLLEDFPIDLGRALQVQIEKYLLVLFSTAKPEIREGIRGSIRMAL